MKNLKIYKRVLALTNAIGIILFSGCSSSNQQKENEEVNSTCNHMIVEFGGQPVIFRECEGYDIHVKYTSYAMFYEVYEDDNIIIDGYSKSGHYYVAKYEDINEIEEMAIEKGAYVYKLN